MERDAIRRMPAPPVVLVSYSGVLGGAERILLDCASRLARPSLVACPEGPLAAAARAAGLTVEPLRERTLHRGASHAAGLLGLAGEVTRLTRRRRPAALVAWGARAGIALAALPRQARPPLLAVHCDLAPDGAAGAAVRAAAGRADAGVALSHAIAASVDPGATVLHPGVDLGAWTPSPLPEGPSRALFLGALVAWKRPDLALEIAARTPGLELELAGAPLPGDDGAVLAGLQRRAAGADLRGRVHFLGGLQDPRPALARAHVLLHCADAEPYGLALVEALAAGRPVVAPDAAGPREIVTPECGRLYRPGDAAAGAAALREVLAGGVDGARERAEAFDVEASAGRLRAAITSVEAGRARSR
jgi:glycosyltransferase involved in cell wall biosynthesis